MARGIDALVEWRANHYFDPAGRFQFLQRGSRRQRRLVRLPASAIMALLTMAAVAQPWVVAFGVLSAWPLTAQVILASLPAPALEEAHQV